jgi:1-acyl-sn-glycerol-3-phosphate acyltransferase
MEAVLLILYTPWQIEMLGAADIPHERISQLFSDLYGFIPVKRGHVDRSALKNALNVLQQKGVIGIFPEGGIWEPGLMRAQTGVAWLSYRGKTPVLPIGFSGTLGSLNQALKLKRPKIVMKVGNPIPPAHLNSESPRKICFEHYAEYVMTQVRRLILPTDPSIQESVKDEQFDLIVKVKNQNGSEISIPIEKQINHPESLTKFLHRPAILKILYSNLLIPIEPLLNLNQTKDPQIITDAIQVILQYLDNKNPYFLTYRFGPKVAEEMKLGLEELLRLSQWASNNKYFLFVTPIRKYYSIKENREIIQTKPEKFKNWM